MRSVAIALAALALLPAAALAQSDVPESVEPQATYKAVTHLDYEGAQVTGKTDGPTIQNVQERVPGDHKRLIVLRANFNPELEQSAGEAR